MTASNNVLYFLPPGLMAPWAGVTTAPPGWLLCNGQAVSRTTYAALYDQLGTTYGSGDGSTTFNVPDLRGRVLIGSGTGTGGGGTGSGLPSGGSGLTARARGDWTGEEAHTLSGGETGAHNHTLNNHDHSGYSNITYSDTHGHTVSAHYHGGGTGYHGHVSVGQVYVNGTPAHGHDGAGAQSSERPNATTGFSTPGMSVGSVGIGNTGDTPGTGGPSGSHSHQVYQDNNNTSTTSGASSHNNVQPMMTCNYIIKF